MIKATVVEATELFEFAERQGIATNIQDLIYLGDADSKHRHRCWFTKPCFIVRWNNKLCLHFHPSQVWAAEVEQMVCKYMKIHDIENLVIVTDEDAYITKFLTVEYHNELMSKLENPGYSQQ